MLVTLLAARLRKLVALLLDSNAKIQNGRAFCKKKREILPTLLRSENFAPKVAKPFVSGHFSQGRKRSEIGRKIFEKCSFLIEKVNIFYTIEKRSKGICWFKSHQVIKSSSHQMPFSELAILCVLFLIFYIYYNIYKI